MYIIVHNQMSQNAARTNIADTAKAGMIAGPHTASQNGPTSVSSLPPYEECASRARPNPQKKKRNRLLSKSLNEENISM